LGKEPVAIPEPCSVAGAPQIVAPLAMVASGVEVRSLGDDIGIGFAPSDHDGQVSRLDASTLVVSSSVAGHSRSPVRRVTPTLSSQGALSALIDAEQKGDSIRGRRTVATDPPLQFGAANASLVWAKSGGATAGKLWPLDGNADVEALRGAFEGAGAERTIALAFRRDNEVALGIVTGDDSLATRGELARWQGLGPAVGSPALAIQDNVLLVAWADRPSARDPWGVRWIRLRPGQPPGEPSTFTPPSGGGGEGVMSPSIASIPGGFLLVWTEGPAARHDVRALTIAEDGRPVGDALDISKDGGNAGQAQAAVNGSGRGVVAFLQSAAGGFAVAATPIVCRH
jgi:hypothetical protein